MSFLLYSSKLMHPSMQNQNLSNVRLPSLSAGEPKASQKHNKKSRNDSNVLSKSAPAGSR